MRLWSGLADRPPRSLRWPANHDEPDRRDDICGLPLSSISAGRRPWQSRLTADVSWFPSGDIPARTLPEIVPIPGNLAQLPARDLAPRAPDLRFAGVLEAWACRTRMDSMWILEIHASEASVDEGMRAWQIASTLAPPPQYRCQDSFDRTPDPSSTSPMSFPAQPSVQLSPIWTKRPAERWINVTRWRIRAEIQRATRRFTTVVDMIGPLVVRDFGHMRPVMACVANTGDDTVTDCEALHIGDRNGGRMASDAPAGSLREANRAPPDPDGVRQRSGDRPIRLGCPVPGGRPRQRR